jgi:hypothetical protein
MQSVEKTTVLLSQEDTDEDDDMSVCSPACKVRSSAKKYSKKIDSAAATRGDTDDGDKTALAPQDGKCYRDHRRTIGTVLTSRIGLQRHLSNT